MDYYCWQKYKRSLIGTVDFPVVFTVTARLCDITQKNRTTQKQKIFQLFRVQVQIFCTWYTLHISWDLAQTFWSKLIWFLGNTFGPAGLSAFHSSTRVTNQLGLVYTLVEFGTKCCETKFPVRIKLTVEYVWQTPLRFRSRFTYGTEIWRHYQISNWSWS